MTANFSPRLAHMGIACIDIDKMIDFYISVFNLVLTDKGPGNTFPYMLAFLSANPSQHHQLAMAQSRPAGAPSTVMQLSFKVDTLDDLREARRRALDKGATKMRGPTMAMPSPFTSWILRTTRSRSTWTPRGMCPNPTGTHWIWTMPTPTSGARPRLSCGPTPASSRWINGPVRCLADRRGWPHTPGWGCPNSRHDLPVRIGYGCTIPHH